MSFQVKMVDHPCFVINTDYIATIDLKEFCLAIGHTIGFCFF